tara:strand:+ start:9353 stop:10732 length:1380 start_codon:yes stop_codon:yes gene_type:complete
MLSHTPFVVLLWVATFFATPTNDVVEHFPSGEVQREYQTNADGERDGSFVEYALDGSILIKAQYANGEFHGREQRFQPDGKKILVATWKRGVLDGRHETFHANGKKAITCGYRNGELAGKYTRSSEDGSWVMNAVYNAGKLNGNLKVRDDGKVVAQQVWKNGELLNLDGIVPFPRSSPDLIAELVRAQHQPVTGDESEQERVLALHRLQTYRALCGLNWQGMTLVPEWNECCAAAAELCRRLGRLSHTPERLPDTDEELYNQGYRGASSSNLSMGTSLPGSIDSYMDDSDPSNVDRVGHRRWCINPTMLKTGFGRSGGFSAMWSFDTSGKPIQGMDAVMFPPAGFVPTQMFGSHYAWSITPLKGSLPKVDSISVTMQKLGELYLPDGDPVPVESVMVDPGSYGAGPTLIFEPQGIVVGAGNAYRCRVSYDGGRSYAFDYVVAFVSDERLECKQSSDSRL